MADATYFVWRRSAMAIHGRADTNVSTAYLPETSVFQYNQNGNLTNDGVKAFFYDDENQLTRIMATNAWKSEFTYDGKMRRRIRKEYTWRPASGWTLTNEVRYIYDRNLVIQERDANNLAQVTYTRGKDLSGSLEGAGGIGGLLARTDNGQFTAGLGQAHAYYHADGNGNVTMLINTQQVAVARYLYDPFGNVLSRSGLLADANVYRFSSTEGHEPSGLQCYLYRCYSSALQRWQRRDPLGDEIFFEQFIKGRGTVEQARLRHESREHNYRFVVNSPMNFIDPLGLVIKCSECEKFKGACAVSLLKQGGLGLAELVGGAFVGTTTGIAAGAGTTVATGGNVVAGTVVGVSVGGVLGAKDIYDGGKIIGGLDDQKKNMASMYSNCLAKCQP